MSACPKLELFKWCLVRIGRGPAISQLLALGAERLHGEGSLHHLPS